MCIKKVINILKIRIFRANRSFLFFAVDSQESGVNHSHHNVMYNKFYNTIGLGGLLVIEKLSGCSTN